MEDFMNNRTITVKGVGSASTKPDYVTLSLRVSFSDKEYQEAVNGANRRVHALENAVVEAGFDKTELKTHSFNVETDYDNVEEGNRYMRVFAGYNCVYGLKLSFDLDALRLANTLTAISKSESEAEVDVRFTVKNPESVKAELLKSAAKNAREKAEILAEASGVTLGELLAINYDWTEVRFASETRYCRAYGADMVADAMPEFNPEDIESSDSAAFVWEIK